jgi:hypothetical protein
MFVFDSKCSNTKKCNKRVSKFSKLSTLSSVENAKLHSHVNRPFKIYYLQVLSLKFQSKFINIQGVDGPSTFKTFHSTCKIMQEVNGPFNV